MNRPKSVSLYPRQEQTVTERRSADRHDRRYKTYRWQRIRASFMCDHPLCEECQRNGFTTPSQVVDHIIPAFVLEGDRFYDTNNLQALCNQCNRLKGQTDKKKYKDWPHVDEYGHLITH